MRRRTFLHNIGAFILLPGLLLSKILYSKKKEGEVTRFARLTEKERENLEYTMQCMYCGHIVRGLENQRRVLKQEKTDGCPHCGVTSETAKGRKPLLPPECVFFIPS